MRLSTVCAAAAAAVLALADSVGHAAATLSPSPARMRDSHGVELPRGFDKRASVRANCDPSKWKGPVDGKYATNGKVDPTKINVHLISHSHDDPGWLVGIDQYYMERVQYILDTVVKELVENPDRQFMYVEQSFFQRWWHEQGSAMQATVKELVRQGRLDLSVNGGWCMHDEATPHYSAMVDQTAYGHHLLKAEFNVTPRIGWQIDPFGHSATQGSLLSAGVGFDALYFARMDYEDYDTRKGNRNLEFIWRPSKSRGKHSQVFTGEIIDHYGPPREFNYGYRDAQIQDDPELHDFNICGVVEDFVAMATERNASTQGQHIFIPMGDDFQFDNARMWYKNMDKLIHYVNQDARVSVLYSNLSYYTDLKLAEKLQWTVKTDDFFPYGSAMHAYWSGFFTSRPTLKRFARVANTLLQQVRQLNALYASHHAATLDALQRAVGLVQHHDGLTGTEKQTVADDYALRLSGGVMEATHELNAVLFVIGEKQPYELCLLANTSICDISTSNKKFEVFVHNSLARTSVQTISLPVVYSDVTIDVLAGGVTVRRFDVFDAVPVHKNQTAAPHTLVFTTELEPLRDARFLVTVQPTREDASKRRQSSLAIVNNVVTLENDRVRVEIDKSSGAITSIYNKQTNVELPVQTDIGYYQSYQDPKEQRSGAYIFRPDSKIVHSVLKQGDSVTMVDLSSQTDAGKPATRVAFQIGSWITLEYRVSDNVDAFVEIEWTVGSIPIEDSIGKEIVLRFDTKIQSNALLYTDANAMEFVERKRNHRDTFNLTLHDDQEFVAANYFPITAAAYIKDAKTQFSVVTDRAQGAASLADGQIEIMLHRRMLTDDGKGVGEALNETESYFDTALRTDTTRGLIVRGTFFVGVDRAADGMESLRTKMESTFFAPLVALRKPVPVEDDDEGKAKVPWLSVHAFPPNVGLTTLVELTKECVMVRLTHLFAVDEHATLSQPALVDFAKLFGTTSGIVASVTELTLTGVAPLASRTREPFMHQWQTLEAPVVEKQTIEPEASRPVRGTSVELQAMEVRSFRVCFAKATPVPFVHEEDANDAAMRVVDALRDAKERAFVELAATESDLAALERVMAIE